MFTVRVGKDIFIDTTEIISRWYKGDQIFVRIRTEDERQAFLQYFADTDIWAPCLVPVREGDKDFTEGKSKPGNPEWATSMRASMKKKELPSFIIRPEDIPKQEPSHEQDSNCSGCEEVL